MAGDLRRELFALLAGVFMQARSRLAAFACIGALLAEPGDRRSCWQLAEAAGHRSPRRMQALLAGHRWDRKAALAALQQFITARLGDPEAILALDETAGLKKGTATVGVARQYAGITGQVENCQTVVFAAYVTHRAHAAFDFRLYLPKAWSGGRARARVPGGVRFATKPALAAAMVTAAAWSCVPFAWVAGDEVYGRSGQLRRACERAGKGYVPGVPVNFRVTLPSGRTAAISAVAAMTPGTAWETRSCGPGCKGRRDYAWAWAATASPRHWALIRRSLANPADLAFFYCHVPQGRPVTLTVLVRTAGTRWRRKNATSREKARRAWTSTRSGSGAPSTATPCCPCAPRRCWPSPPPGKPPPRRQVNPGHPPAALPSPPPGAIPASCPPPPVTGRPPTPAWSRSASPRPAAWPASPPRP